MTTGSCGQVTAPAGNGRVLASVLIAVTLLSVPLTPEFAGAESAPTITLADSIQAVLRRDNDSIRVQDEKVKTASSAAQQAAGQFDWGVQAQTGWQALYVPRVLNGVVPGKGVLTNQTDILSAYFYNLSVGREFRNGVQIAPGVTAYPSTSGATTAQTFGLTALRPSLGLRIPLIQGLGQEAADSAELAAKATLNGTRFDRDFAIAHVAHDVVQIYWRCVAAAQVADISVQSLKDGEEYASSMKEQAARGLVEKSVAEAADAADATRRITLQQNQDAAVACRRDLAMATTGEAILATPAPVPAGRLPEIEGADAIVDGLNVNALNELALNNRSDLKAAREYVSAALASRKGAEDTTSPNLTLSVDPTRALVIYSQSLENNASEGRAAQALSAQRQAEIALHQLETQIQVDITDALRNLKGAITEWRTASDAVSQTAAAVASDEKRARFGVLARRDLLTTKDQLTLIETDRVNAELLFASSVATLRLITGTVHPEEETAAASAEKFASLPAPG
ncbi:MAG TPA: TolC family protein [Rhizomicrobium sp.]|nr:TolC family protein [Rhizomicrobium sp.]